MAQRVNQKDVSLRDAKCCHTCAHFDGEPYETFGRCQKFQFPSYVGSKRYFHNQVEMTWVCDSYEER